MANSGGGGQSTLDLFDQALGRNETLKLSLIEGSVISFCGRRTVTVQLKDSSQRTLLLFKLIPGESSRHYATETVMQITNTSGQALITAKGVTFSSMTVWSGTLDQFYGRIVGTNCFTSLEALGSTNEHLFYIENGMCCNPCCSTSSNHNIIANGVTIARLQNSNDISLFNARNVDTRTKACLVFAGCYMYTLYHADTSACGRIGVIGITKRATFMFLIIVLLALGLIYYFKLY